MNSLMYMDKTEYLCRRSEFVKMYIIKEIDLSLITDEQTYLDIIGSVFGFPIFPGQKGHSWNGYFDWMRDLSWIFDDTANNCKSGVFIALHNSDMLLDRDNGDMIYHKIIDSYIYDILPWWSYDAERYVVGGCKRDFVICLVK